MNPLDMRDIAVIDAFPVYKFEKTVLNIGCGEGRIDYYLAMTNYQVYATDIKRYETWRLQENLTFHEADIFDLSGFPIKSSPIVICSQVLEHLSGYKTALVHLLALTEVRLIITVPHYRSFRSPDHINFWDDPIPRATPGALPGHQCKDVHEFVTLCHPYSTAISKIRTKPKDVEMGQWNYLITVDMRQNI